MSDPATALQRVREELLDLSPRNRLLDSARHRQHGSGLEIIERRSEEVFQTLVRKRRTVGFAPSSQTSAARQADDGAPRLQTRLSPDRLQSRLRRLHDDARTIYEERGIATLHLALGFLEWYDTGRSEQPRLAPLLLIPVRLERASPSAPFELALADGETVANVDLAHKLEQALGLELPAPAEADALDPGAHLRACAEAVSGAPRFRVHPDDVVLGLFSLTRRMMHRDLDPAGWPTSSPLHERPLIRALLGAGFRDEPAGVPDEASLDGLLNPLETAHVLDADDAQSRAIEDVRRGRNLVIHGPPGTGKSQTIANLIAAAVRDGRKVLFVAEKMAALEVVRRRLERLDLAPVCLGLHERGTGGRHLLDDLERTLGLDRPRVEPAEPLARQLTDLRRILNRHAESLHTPLEPSGLTPFALIGHLIRLVGRGTRRAEVRLSSAPAWTRAEIDERYGQIEALIACLERVGVPARHVWRGAGLRAVPAELERIGTQTEQLARSLQGLMQATAALSASLGAGPGRDAAQAARLLDTCEYLSEAPQPVDAAALDSACWRTRRQDIARLVAAGMTLEANQEPLRRIFRPIAWSIDVRALRRRLAAHRRFRVPAARPDYWRARTELQRLAHAPLPRTIEAQITLLDQLREAQEARREVERLRPLGAQAFGRIWRGPDSPWGHLASIEQWQGEGDEPHLLPDAPRLLSRLAAHGAGAGRLTLYAQQLLERVTAGCERLFAQLELDRKAVFGHAELAEVPFDSLRDRLQAWSAHADELADWAAYRGEASRAEEHGLGSLVERLHHGHLPVERAFDAFEAALFEPLLRHAMRRLPALAAFDGDAHERLIERFRELDRAAVDRTRAEVAYAHHDRLPARAPIAAMAAPEEASLEQRPTSIRALLAQAGSAVQAAKPVFMMSPYAVAEHLPPASVRFDLLVIDEASQMEPVAALGAMARAEQVVVVGDERQLPPTPLMSGPLTDRIEADDGPPEGAGLQSILDLCVAQGMPQRALRWHYRSRHPSLITFSNREFYGNDLCVVPSAFLDHARLGLAFRHVPDGVYDRGGSRTNRREAKAVARAVLDHARQRTHESLGVACLSTAQRDAIAHEIDRLRRAEPDLERVLASGQGEPFFIKSLEHIQGDERDVVLISLGYGVDPSGHLTHGFGPLSADDGERRLNVLITRARQRLEVFSSIRARDLVRPGRPGVAALKAFLEYAESGALTDTRPAGDGGADSPLEAHVAAALADLGHQVESRVDGGFLVDLAVRDAERPGRYLLGIACDGASYAAAPSARDRDRLRQQVLEDRGWIIHRVWSGDWFRRPAQELRRLATAIEAARDAWRARDASAEEPFAAREPTPAAIPREPAGAEVRPAMPVAAPYVEADFALQKRVEPHLLPIEQMVDAVVWIIEIEGPIHRQEIARRLIRVCGAGSFDRRTIDAANRGLARALRRGLISREGDFYAPPGAAEPPLRDRSETQESLRRPDMLPPAEIRAAALRLVRTQPDLRQGDLPPRIARLLGFESLSDELRAVIEAVIERLLREGRLDRTSYGTLREKGRSAA